MLTIDTIVKELNNVPVDRLQDLYSIILSMQADTIETDKQRKKILSFAGAFEDMPEKDYNDFLQQTKDTRNNLFDRDFTV